MIRRIWTAAEIPSQTGKTAIITGGSSGLGFETARALARAGAEVVIASLNPERGAAAVERIRAEAPESAVEFVQLDTSTLASVASFADAMLRRFPSLDVLVNCAGIGGFAIGWTRRTTVDGFERAFATNYLGHFALTGYLLPALIAAPSARVVSVSSLAHWFGRIQFDDLQLERKFLPNTAYEQSKLALLLFGLELHRRARAAGLTLSSIPVHPGISRTDIFQRSLRPGSIMSWLLDAAMYIVGQPAGQGALPVIFAAAAPDAESGRYYGPDGLLEIQGWPAPARIAPWVRDPTLAARLWEVSEQISGMTYRFEAPSAPPVSAATEIDGQERSLRYDEPA